MRNVNSYYYWNQLWNTMLRLWIQHKLKIVYEIKINKIDNI